MLNSHNNLKLTFEVDHYIQILLSYRCHIMGKKANWFDIWWTWKAQLPLQWILLW